MTTQWILVGLTALLAGAYLARLTWRSWTASGCGKGCGCSAAPAKQPGLVSADELTARVKGRAPGGA
jgi:hypothetical protein